MGRCYMHQWGRYRLAGGARISTQDLNRCVAVSHRHCYADGPVTAQIRAALERLGLFFKQVFSLNFHTAFGSTTWVANRGAIGEARCCTFSRAIATTMAAAVSDVASATISSSSWDMVPLSDNFSFGALAMGTYEMIEPASSDQFKHWTYQKTDRNAGGKARNWEEQKEGKKARRKAASGLSGREERLQKVEGAEQAAASRLADVIEQAKSSFQEDTQLQENGASEVELADLWTIVFNHQEKERLAHNGCYQSWRTTS